MTVCKEKILFICLEITFYILLHKFHSSLINTPTTVYRQHTLCRRKCNAMSSAFSSCLWQTAQESPHCTRCHHAPLKGVATSLVLRLSFQDGDLLHRRPVARVAPGLFSADCVFIVVQCALLGKFLTPKGSNFSDQRIIESLELEGTTEGGHI